MTQKNEQFRILLERQREQILADCQAEIRKHEFQADCDRRSIQKLNEMIESQKGEICSAHQGDERLGRDQQLLREHLSEQSLSEMEELKRFQEEDWSKIRTLSLNSQAKFRNYRMKSII